MTCCKQWRDFVVATVAPLFIMFAAMPALAQTFSVLHTFTGGADGANPAAGLVMDRGGRLYGTSSAGAAGFGTVFKLAPSGSGSTFSPLYAFTGGADGATPMAALTFGPDGGLYGTTTYGGSLSLCTYVVDNGCGVVFELRPPASFPRTAFTPWGETVLYAFNNTQGAWPFGEVIFDSQGNLYGTTYTGGLHSGAGTGGGCFANACGTVYELSPSNGSWNLSREALLSADTSSNPVSGLAMDQQGALYGVASYTGPSGYGTLLRLTPSGSSFALDILTVFLSQEGGNVYSTPVLDAVGNLYDGNPGVHGEFMGEVFSINSLGGYSSLFSFTPGDGPYGDLMMDTHGNLYGTTEVGGAHNYGSVFKLTPGNGGWMYTDLHDFQQAEGCNPLGKILVDGNGNLYGTTSRCGANQLGSVWEITP